MSAIRFIQTAVLAIVPFLCFAQDNGAKSAGVPTTGATDCPTWNNKKTTNRGSFLEFMRNSQGKQLSAMKKIPDSLEKTTTATNFYTQRRYNRVAKNPVIPSGDSKETPLQLSATEKAKIKAPEETPMTETVTDPKIEHTPMYSSSYISTQKIPQSKNLESGSTQVESSKKHSSRFKTKLIRFFSKKTNRPAKPNYEKCTTKF